MTTERVDAVIVGAGIVGALIADELSESGLRVEIVEAGPVAGGASGAGMGHVLVLDDSETELALTRAAREAWATMRPLLPPEAEMEVRGTLWVAEDEAQLAIAEEKAARYRRAGVGAELRTATQLASDEPQLRAGLAGGFRVPGDAVVYPPAVVHWALDRARSRGARIRRGEARAIEAGRIELDDGTIEAETIVIANGVRAPELLPALPIRPRRGHLAITARAPGFVRHQTMELGYFDSAHGGASSSVAFNVQPRATGQLLIGSSRDDGGLDAPSPTTLTAQMLIRAVSFMPRLRSLPVIRTWTGVRPATPDNLPYVGPWTPMPGVWVAAGHEGLGITTAPVTARLLADLILSRPAILDPEPFRPLRMGATS